MNKELEEAKKSIRKTRKLITFFVGLLGVLLFAIIGLVIWAIIQERQTPASFAECVTDKDAKILESYPEQCVVDSKTFANPAQKAVEETKEELSSDAWLIYTPNDEAYTVKLIDGWSFESYAVQNNGKETLVACFEACNEYKKADPAQLVNKTGRYSGNAKLVIAYGSDPMLAATFMAANDIELKDGNMAKKYVYNDGQNTTYMYVIKGKETTVTAQYTQPNAATSNLEYVEEMVSTITTN